ncbi:hypothetical protein LTR12_013752 [Friedmanniomyces endolithicus]|nr:hypothetical protein LTR74_003955 [Friedmanniomyces endolithicus]KAK1811854.1 hypothetical protein LTR12_013752 [Friedmanniomyces endolithicus]
MAPPQPIPLHTLLPSTDPASIPTLPLPLTLTLTRTLAPLPRRLALASRHPPPSQIGGADVRARRPPAWQQKAADDQDEEADDHDDDGGLVEKV